MGEPNHHIGKLLRGCEVCERSASHHRVYGTRMCCKCYVRAGYAPAEWHPQCMAEAAAKKAKQHDPVPLQR